jgi:hypothetical protein
MANYRESSVSGSKWQRATRVVVDNQLGNTPSIYFEEEEVVNFDGTAFKKPVGIVNCVFEASKEIPLINPATGEALGTSITQMEIYVALHSLYMQLVAARDIPVQMDVPVEEPPVDPPAPPPEAPIVEPPVDPPAEEPTP